MMAWQAWTRNCHPGRRGRDWLGPYGGRGWGPAEAEGQLLRGKGSEKGDREVSRKGPRAGGGQEGKKGQRERQGPLGLPIRGQKIKVGERKAGNRRGRAGWGKK